MTQMHLVYNKTEIMQHVLKMQKISFFPKHLKEISRGVRKRRSLKG